MIKGLNERILDICRRLDNHHFLTQELLDRYKRDLAVLLKQRDKYVETTKKNKEEAMVSAKRDPARVPVRNPTYEEAGIPPVSMELPRESAALDKHEISSLEPTDHKRAQEEERDERSSLPKHCKTSPKK